VGRRGESLKIVILHLFHISILVGLWLTLSYWSPEKCSSSLLPRLNTENRRGPSYRKCLYKGTTVRDPEPLPGTEEQDKGAKGRVRKLLVTETQITC